MGVTHQLVHGEGQEVAEPDLLGPLPARNLESETRSGDQEAPNPSGPIAVTYLGGDSTQAVRGECAHDLES